MTERHREMARRLVLGERQCDVARSCGISQQRLSDIARSPVFMEYLESLSQDRDQETLDIMESVKSGAQSGLDLLLRILTHGTDEYRDTDIRTKAQVARDLLDREGSAPRMSRTQSQQQSTTLHLTRKDIEELKDRARAINALID
jgi:hypothetical protein